ncbi:MAG: trimethylamine methyltransferase family protein [Candidatus Hydrogenedentota bacterium]|nr:MAG: trimethylamine methyltransferase family protein [Candidatus Hydrogenedentota bacterium]
MARPLLLSSEHAATVHEASLHVLEKTGIYLNHQEMEELLLEAGAEKDQEHRILIPRRLVEQALEKASPQIHLYDRNGNESILLGKGRTYFGPGSDSLYNYDMETKELRLSVLSDVGNNARLADALGFDFMMSMALPEDVEQDKLYSVVFAEMLKNTTKPLVVTSTSLEDLRRNHEIASIVRGGKENLRKKPFWVAYIEPISPLIFDEISTDRLQYCAEHGIPFLFAAGANCGGGAPVTVEGGVVQGTAESLAGLVLATLKNEKVRFVYGTNTSSMDMRTMIVSYGSPEWAKTVAMYAEMGEYYHLPSWGTAGCSDSYVIDAQSAMEAYEGIFWAVQSGTTLAHDVGFLGHGEMYHPGMLILTDMMIQRARYVLRKLDLSDEALATGVIDEVARSGNLYVAHPHTAKHFRQALWIPPPWIYRDKVEQLYHRKDLVDLLTDEATAILARHSPEDLCPCTVKEIDDYLASL